MSEEFYEKALEYHREGKPGKIDVSSHKSMDTHQDLSLAYTPGVAAPVREILKNPNMINEILFFKHIRLIALVMEGITSFQNHSIQD